jgi:hypothetical protein
MIDITVYDNRVEIENKIFKIPTGQDESIRLITEILNKAKYSGENMILRKRVRTLEENFKEYTEDIDKWYK